MATALRYAIPLFVLLGLAPASFGADMRMKPLQVIDALRDRMYAIAETTGKPEEWQAAIEHSRQEIRDYVADGGDPADLTEKDAKGMTPLIAAAYTGYPEIVNELLNDQRVRAGVNDIDSYGLSAWDYANFAPRQSAWLCNPAIVQSMFALVPLLVTQSYYLSGSEPPYRKVRRLLETAGAKVDMASAKEKWLHFCKSAEEDIRQKVQASDDLLETLVKEAVMKWPLRHDPPK